MQFDLITCNPPWIPAEHMLDTSPLDNGVYDPKESFLHSALNFACNIDSIIYFRNPFITKRRNASDIQ